MPSDCDEATDIRFPKDMVMELAGRKAEYNLAAFVQVNIAVGIAGG